MLAISDLFLSVYQLSPPYSSSDDKNTVQIGVTTANWLCVIEYCQLPHNKVLVLKTLGLHFHSEALSMSMFMKIAVNRPDICVCKSSVPCDVQRSIVLHSAVCGAVVPAPGWAGLAGLGWAGLGWAGPLPTSKLDINHP